MFPVVILAGGLATRLRPLTEKIPKSLIEICGRPFIEYQLEYLSGEGLSDVVIATGFLGEMIESAVGYGDRFGLDIRYSHDGDQLLGTGGAIKKALPIIASDSFFVLYGDSYLPVKYGLIQQAYNGSMKPALMTVYENKNSFDTSNVIFDGINLQLYDKQKYDMKMNYIDYGLTIMSKSVFDDEKYGDVFDLSDVFHDLSKNNQLVGYEVFERFYEIGSFKGIEDMEKLIKNKEIK